MSLIRFLSNAITPIIFMFVDSTGTMGYISFLLLIYSVLEFYTFWQSDAFDIQVMFDDVIRSQR